VTRQVPPPPSRPRRPRRRRSRRRPRRRPRLRAPSTTTPPRTRARASPRCSSEIVLAPHQHRQDGAHRRRRFFPVAPPRTPVSSQQTRSPCVVFFSQAAIFARIPRDLRPLPCIPPPPAPATSVRGPGARLHQERRRRRPSPPPCAKQTATAGNRCFALFVPLPSVQTILTPRSLFIPSPTHRHVPSVTKTARAQYIHKKRPKKRVASSVFLVEGAKKPKEEEEVPPCTSTKLHQNNV
jgi:hypothetical protein